MKTRGDGFAGFCLDTPLRDVIFLSRLSRHCCAAGKKILSVQTIPKSVGCSDRRCGLLFFFAMRHISDTHESCQTTNSLLHWNSAIEARVQEEYHIPSRSRKSAGQRHGLQSKLDHHTNSYDNRRDQRHASGYELMCHLFWGPNGAKSATIEQTTQGCAILRTCLSNNNDRVPRSLAGSLARSLDLTYCSSRFVKKGQLEYRCKLRISVLVLRVWWALIGWAGW
jgi:hypothetical protein